MRTLPHIPNYRLYNFPGSPCDTLGISAVKPGPAQRRALSAYPNPAGNQVTFFLEQQVESNWTIMDISGRVWRNGNISREQPSFTVTTEAMPTGIYVCTVRTSGGSFLTHKVVIQH